ncbi:MAG: hypothetical protein ACE5DO_11905 [Desulfobacterales bacterium]
MSKILIPTKGPEDWKNFLAEPSKQWRSGYSAKTLAYCWEATKDFPDCVRKVFSQSGMSRFKDIELLLAIPEYQVPIPGGSRPSQNDIFVLARAEQQLMTITVEGKVSEPFGPTIDEWLKKDSSGKRKRLSYLCEKLGLPEEVERKIRYQLLHRTASALIEAERFSASSALMLVHSFSHEHAWLEDYQAFLALFGKGGEANSVTYAGKKNGIDLYLSWVVGDKKFLKV